MSVFDAIYIATLVVFAAGLLLNRSENLTEALRASVKAYKDQTGGDLTPGEEVAMMAATFVAVVVFMLTPVVNTVILAAVLYRKHLKAH